MVSTVRCLGILALVSKCANPECSAGFRYLHEGKLFQFEVRLEELATDAPAAGHNERLSREVEWFWLCESCASTMTVVREPRTCRILIVPLPEDVRGEHTAPSTSSDKLSGEHQHNLDIG